MIVMIRPAVRSSVSLLLMIGGLQAALLASARAENCVAPSRQASKEAVKSFTDDPSSLLGESGGKLAADVRNLAVTSPDAIEAMPKLLQGASAEQAGAIGSGLGQAALVCRRTAPGMALFIQKDVVGSSKQEVVAAYEAVVQEQVTTAVDPSAPATEPPSNDSIQGGGPFPYRSPERAGGALPLTSYYATPAVIAVAPGGDNVTKVLVPVTSTILVPVTPSTSNATDSVSPSR